MSISKKAGRKQNCENRPGIGCNIMLYVKRKMEKFLLSTHKLHLLNRHRYNKLLVVRFTIIRLRDLFMVRRRYNLDFVERSTPFTWG